METYEKRLGKMNCARAFSEISRKVIILFAWSLSLQLLANQPDSVYVVAFYTQSEKEAIKGVEKVIESGYRGEVYLAPINKYVVTIGKVTYKQAQKLKQKALEKGIVPRYAYLSTGREFEKRVYPPAVTIDEAPPENTAEQDLKSTAGGTTGKQTAKPPASPALDYKVVSQGVFIIVGSTNSQANAIKQADDLFRKGYQGEVYWTVDRKYVVAIGPYAEGQIRQIKNEVIQKGAAGSSAYITDGKEFLEKNYSTEGNKRFTGTAGNIPADSNINTEPATDEGPSEKVQPEPRPSPAGRSGSYFVVVKLSGSEEEAKTLAQDLEKKGYEVKVYLTNGQQYAITLGYFPKDQAELIRENAIKYGDAGDDATLSTGKDFVKRVYPST
jgi:hypothetical protein